MKRYYMGIDPGEDGCLSIICPKKIMRFPFKDNNMVDILNKSEVRKLLPNIICTIEEPQVFGQSNPKTLLVLGKNYGYLTGILEAFDIAYMSVYPKEWKRTFKITGLPKSASIGKVHELYPKADLYRTKKCTTEHDGIADSILIAEYGKRREAELTG